MNEICNMPAWAVGGMTLWSAIIIRLTILLVKEGINMFKRTSFMMWLRKAGKTIAIILGTAAATIVLAEIIGLLVKLIFC